MFVGFQGEGPIPFIPKMNIMAGGFNLSENLKITLNYEVNLIALYTFAQLAIKKILDPNSVSPIQLENWERKTWLSGFKPNLKLGCKNGNRNGYCKKLESKCMAFEMRDGEPHLNFKKCKILVNDAKKALINEWKSDQV